MEMSPAALFKAFLFTNKSFQEQSIISKTTPNAFSDYIIEAKNGL